MLPLGTSCGSPAVVGSTCDELPAQQLAVTFKDKPVSCGSISTGSGYGQPMEQAKLNSAMFAPPRWGSRSNPTTAFVGGAHAAVVLLRGGVYRPTTASAVRQPQRMSAARAAAAAGCCSTLKNRKLNYVFALCYLLLSTPGTPNISIGLLLDEGRRSVEDVRMRNRSHFIAWEAHRR